MSLITSYPRLYYRRDGVEPLTLYSNIPRPVYFGPMCRVCGTCTVTRQNSTRWWVASTKTTRYFLFNFLIQSFSFLTFPLLLFLLFSLFPSFSLFLFLLFFFSFFFFLPLHFIIFPMDQNSRDQSNALFPYNFDLSRRESDLPLVSELPPINNSSVFAAQWDSSSSLVNSQSSCYEFADSEDRMEDDENNEDDEEYYENGDTTLQDIVPGAISSINLGTLNENIETLDFPVHKLIDRLSPQKGLGVTKTFGNPYENISPAQYKRMRGVYKTKKNKRIRMGLNRFSSEDDRLHFQGSIPSSPPAKEPLPPSSPPATYYRDEDEDLDMGADLNTQSTTPQVSPSVQRVGYVFGSNIRHGPRIIEDESGLPMDSETTSSLHSRNFLSSSTTMTSSIGSGASLVSQQAGRTNSLYRSSIFYNVSPELALKHVREAIEQAFDEGKPVLSLTSLSLREVPSIVKDIDTIVTLDNTPTEIDLSQNELETICPELFDISKLSVLDLACNRLTTLSPAIGKLAHLAKLDLNSNRLSYLPAELFLAKDLQSLTFSGNRFLPIPEKKEVTARILREKVSHGYENRGKSFLAGCRRYWVAFDDEFPNQKSLLKIAYQTVNLRSPSIHSQPNAILTSQTFIASQHEPYNTKPIIDCDHEASELPTLHPQSSDKTDGLASQVQIPTLQEYLSRQLCQFRLEPEVIKHLDSMGLQHMPALFKSAKETHQSCGVCWGAPLVYPIGYVYEWWKKPYFPVSQGEFVIKRSFCSTKCFVEWATEIYTTIPECLDSPR